MTGSMRLLILASIVLPAACMPRVDLMPMTDLVPSGTGQYTYRSVANVQYPDGNATAERHRLKLLGDLVAKNGLCPAGYSVIARQAVIKTETPVGDVKDLIYTVKCR